MKHLITISKWLITIGIFWWIANTLDFTQFLQTMGNADWTPIAIAIPLLLAGQIVAAYRWWLLAGDLRLVIPVHRAFRHHFSGLFFGLFFPGLFGVDAVRAWGLNQDLGGGRLVLAGYSVVADRVNGLFGLTALSATTSLFFTELIPTLWRDAILLVILALLGGWMITPFLLRLTMLQQGPLRQFIPQELHSFWTPQSCWWPAVILATIQQVSSAGVGILVCQALHLSAPPLFLLFMMPTTVLISSLPIAIAGHGLREGIFVIQLGWLGIATAQGLAFGVLYFFSFIWIALLGGVIFLLTHGALPSAQQLATTSLREGSEIHASKFDLPPLHPPRIEGGGEPSF